MWDLLNRLAGEGWNGGRHEAGRHSALARTPAHLRKQMEQGLVTQGFIMAEKDV